MVSGGAKKWPVRWFSPPNLKKELSVSKSDRNC
jgi:hypothetical protein